jgi:hypothetical protein
VNVGNGRADRGNHHEQDEYGRVLSLLAGRHKARIVAASTPAVKGRQPRQPFGSPGNPTSIQLHTAGSINPREEV